MIIKMKLVYLFGQPQDLRNYIHIKQSSSILFISSVNVNGDNRKWNATYAVKPRGKGMENPNPNYTQRGCILLQIVHLFINWKHNLS